MKKIILIFSMIASTCIGQDDSLFSSNYLCNNRVDLLSPNFNFPIDPTTKIVGLSAMHGSSKTEDVELLIVRKLVAKGLKYYFPEIDFSLGYFLNEYIKSGDEDLLIDIIKHNVMVPQEQVVEVLKKWKQFQPLFKENDIQIIGVDRISSYKYTLKHLLKLFKGKQWEYFNVVSKNLERLNVPNNWERTFMANGSDTVRENIKAMFLDIINDFEFNNQYYNTLENISEIQFIFSNIQYIIKESQERISREELIYSNFIVVNQDSLIKNSLKFVRMGSGHIIGFLDYESFLTKLINRSDFQYDEIIRINCFLSQSSVLKPNRKRLLSSIIFKHNLTATNYLTKRNLILKNIPNHSSGSWTGNSFLEKPLGIEELEKSKLSDITMFNLINDDSPYTLKGNCDLVLYKRRFKRDNKECPLTLATTDFMQRAILIRNSKGNTPIGLYK